MKKETKILIVSIVAVLLIVVLIYIFLNKKNSDNIIKKAGTQVSAFFVVLFT